VILILSAVLLIDAAVFLFWLFWPEEKSPKRERRPVERQRVADIQNIASWRRR
jgi:hypothetical protein